MKDPDFLFHWDRSTVGRRRVKEAAAGSILFHVAGLIWLLSLAPSRLPPVSGEAPSQRFRSTPLVAPPPQLTQRQPNQGRLSTEVSVESLAQRPRVFLPPPDTARAAPPPRLPDTPPPEVSPTLTAQLPPRIELPGGSGLGAPPPPAPPEEKPKLAFETPSGADRSGAATQGGSASQSPDAPPIQRPGSSLEDTIREVARSGRGRGLIVGDLEPGGTPGDISEAQPLSSAPNRTASALELISDPMGVDFRPYLINILATVRRNWYAVMPESAKLGRRGRVAIQFSIDRSGRVPKLVIASPSGAEPLDRAAVASISASHPFPPLPDEFRGAEVRLQFNFTYGSR